MDARIRTLRIADIPGGGAIEVMQAACAVLEAGALGSTPTASCRSGQFSISTRPCGRTYVMRAVLGASAIAALCSTPTLAREPGAGNAYSPGASIGLPTGANPPEGLWFEDTSSVYEGQATDSAGTKDGVKLTALATAPRLLWTTPWTFLGATEMAFVIAPIVNLEVSNFPGLPGVSGHSLAFANPEFTPINLSWNLGVPGLFGSVTFGFYPPIGRYSSNATVNVGDNFWTFQPEAALSYLSADWLLSVHFSIIRIPKIPRPIINPEIRCFWMSQRCVTSEIYRLVL
jgi:hypothetical protein